MDKILESFPLGLLIRSAFSGVFFVISFNFAAHNFVTFDSANIFSVGLPFALIAGFTVYGLHRSLIYPLIEWAFNLQCAFDLREKCLPLISENAVKNLAKIWDSKSANGDDRAFQRGKQIATWGDYTHHQYVSAWCIFSGLTIGFFANLRHHWHHYFRCPILYFLFLTGAVIFLVAAVVSNWRLFSILQHMDKIVPITPNEKSNAGEN
jgi:hypothetical protein